MPIIYKYNQFAIWLPWYAHIYIHIFWESKWIFPESKWKFTSTLKILLRPPSHFDLHPTKFHFDLQPKTLRLWRNFRYQGQRHCPNCAQRLSCITQALCDRNLWLEVSAGDDMCYIYKIGQLWDHADLSSSACSARRARRSLKSKPIGYVEVCPCASETPVLM